mmetsp:Transcript_19435/g.27472  ORF Transcript_19435/g.27472 Transcript_19435/m.27472 type:complete len:316 (-) Transcript_19435:152-1099(-)
MMFQTKTIIGYIATTLFLFFTLLSTTTTVCASNASVNNPFRSRKFSVTGPVLTVTLKDPMGETENPGKWGIDISSLRPNLLWSAQSTAPPLPNWFPALKTWRATMGYRYDDLRKAPSFLEADLAFSNDLGELHLQPTYEVRQRKASVVCQVSRGASYALARFTSRGKKVLEFLRCSYKTDLPFSSLGAVRVTPSFDFTQNVPNLLVEGLTGSGRTKAVLNLQITDPTLTVVHALDERNTIAPEISLHTAKILYQWNIALDSGSIKTKVDPTSAIHVTWTDRSMNGKWVTDFRLPLSGTTLSALAADVRVRRQFAF